ncbi:MAG TPA: substrate-binding domain-containing protein [Pirellulales bacterium]|jgi:ribose transport system substrate-binding protein|nr:substrate-binding domain-containing protein [Pirellulales bacterium]
MLSRIARVGIVVVAAIVAGCGASDGTSSKKNVIAVIPKGTTHEFWKSVHLGAAQAAREHGNCEILWKGPFREDDTDGQISIVQDCITRGVSGIVLAPLNSQALVPYVKEARTEGVPTVIFDSALDDESATISYVATDNRRGGALAARELARQLGGEGNVILLRYNHGSESTEQRENGFLETLQTEFPRIKLISTNQYAGTTPESALEKAENLLTVYGKELDGIFAVCEPNSAGVLGALEQVGQAGKLKFIAFDPSPRLIDALAEKKVSAIILQDPVRMGYLAVRAMLDHLDGKPVEKRIATGEFVATPENMREPEIEKLLHPPIFD